MEGLNDMSGDQANLYKLILHYNAASTAHQLPVNVPFYNQLVTINAVAGFIKWTMSLKPTTEAAGHRAGGGARTAIAQVAAMGGNRITRMASSPGFANGLGQA